MNRPRNEKNDRRDERAVSEVVSFVLVFGTIVLGVAVLSVVGFQAIESYQEREQTRTVDRALDGLSKDFNEILRTDAVTERDHELAAGGGRIAPGEPGPRIEVAVDHADGTDTEAWRLGSFVYGADSGTVAYEGGGSFRTAETGDRTVLTEPRVRCADETAVVSLVKVEEDGRSFQSDGTVSVTATETESYRETFFDVESLDVEFDSDQLSDRGWGEVFDDGWTETDEGWTCSGSADRNIEAVSIHVVTIDIDRSISE